jgi:hypothetical protein
MFFTLCKPKEANTFHRPGSYGYYQQDADTYASWGIG